MTIGGWMVMAATVTGMTGLLCWCVYRVLSTPGSSKHLHSQVDIDTHDREG